VPITDRDGRPFAVMSLLNKKGTEAFDTRDEQAVEHLASSIGVVLRTWHQAYRTRHATRD
jgi:hypothetical protein